jgi:hypothetical protein
MRDWFAVSVPGKRLLYAATVFWSALLLLLVQPVLTKAILPWFGGSAGVWTTSMLFFQCLLLLGYAYAHLVARRLTLPMQMALHVALLLVSLFMLPLRPSPEWRPNPHSDPAIQILGLLLTTVGLPYFLLSSTSPLVQSWFARNTPSDTPYRLFSLSNLGSLVALLLYPFAVEPTLSTQSQMFCWTLGYVGFVALCCVAAVLSRRGEMLAEVRLSIDRRAWTWLALAACPSVLWLAVANQLSQDVAAVPFLWVVPLSLYLLSFVLCFDNEGWYRPRWFRWLLPLAWVAITMAVAQQGLVSLKMSLVMLMGALFVICMFCHGELARLRPEAAQLTAYYLTLSGGGALGGVFVGLVAPRVFNEYLELPIGVFASVILALWLLYDLASKRILRIAAVAAAGTAAATLMPEAAPRHFVRMRNFYGTLQVADTGSTITAMRTLFNGPIQHGMQFLAPERSKMPTTYYGTASGVAIANGTLRQSGAPMRIGVIGLGTGTLAAFGKPGDVIRFYEINPAVIDVANAEFRYIRESEAKVEVEEGDARLSMEREQPHNFDLLVVDAFAGDSIPVHLMTLDAFQLYLRHLKPSGALAIHVTNKHLDLAPVVQRIASEIGIPAALVNNSSDSMNMIHFSSWVILTRNPALNKRLSYLQSPIKGKAPLWTDDYSNLLRILR